MQGLNCIMVTRCYSITGSHVVCGNGKCRHWAIRTPKQILSQLLVKAGLLIRATPLIQTTISYPKGGYTRTFGHSQQILQEIQSDKYPYFVRYSNRVDSSTSAQQAYGTGAVQPPLPPDEVRRLCAEYRTGIAVTKEEALRIERETIQQGDDPTGLWKSLRRPRLTASNFRAICKRRPTTPVANAVKTLLYKSISPNVASLRWGRDNEDCARKAYTEEMARRGTPVSTKRSGLVISTNNGCLACSPDGWVEDENSLEKEGVVEYKCPYASRDITPAEAASRDKNFFCNLENGELKLKKKHNYYYQVQGAMAITKRRWCDFVVWTPKGVSVERIDYDASFWSLKMLPQLLNFYEKALLPELAAPEVPNGRPIREPGTW